MQDVRDHYCHVIKLATSMLKPDLLRPVKKKITRETIKKTEKIKKGKRLDVVCGALAHLL